MVSLEVAIRIELGEFSLQADFDLQTGITALFGPSGAGKTLTLRCIAGLTRPTAGRVVLAGETLVDTAAGVHVRPQHRRIGYVFQQYALFPHLDVAANIGFGLPRLEKPERTARIASLLSLVGLEGMGDRRPGELSGGQQQRVAIARALATNPRLLLLDEPFAAVDLRVRRRLRTELLRIHQATGTPMLLVTHDLGEVRQLAADVVLLENGRVLRRGPTRDLLTQPVDPEIAQLLAEGD
jgi:molybdenum ABC transporter ATP-binding protein